MLAKIQIIFTVNFSLRKKANCIVLDELIMIELAWTIILFEMRHKALHASYHEK